MRARLVETSLMAGILLTPLLLNLDYLARISLTPFLILGCLSLLSTYLPAKYQHLIIPLIYLPAITSLVILVLERIPQYIIDLASGYLISIPFISMIGLIKSPNLRTTVISYITSLTSSYLVWVIAIESTEHGGQLFLSLINVFISREAWERPQPPQIFAALTAFSSIALVIYLWRSYGAVFRREQGDALLLSATAASLAVASVVLYSLFYDDSVALGLIIAASLTLAATLKVGVLK
ncbi:MAG: hypothetical protein QW059_01605 [Nitrososphaerota archaeon]